MDNEKEETEQINPTKLLGKTVISLYISRLDVHLIDRVCEQYQLSRGDIVSWLVKKVLVNPEIKGPNE